jgi:hypothetical protein
MIASGRMKSSRSIAAGSTAARSSNQSKCPQCGHVASPGGRDGSIRTR